MITFARYSEGEFDLQIRGTLMLLLAAFIWGTTFVAQMTGMENLEPFSYAASRFFLGFIFLVGLWIYRLRFRTSNHVSGFKAGLGAGLFMFIASSLQQVSMLYTTAGKAAFITCLYIIFVPLASVFLRKKIRPENWIGAILAICGLYLLAIHEDFSVGAGDLMLLVSSFFWTAQILFIDRFASKVDVVELSTAQIFVCMILSSIVAIGFESPTFESIGSAWFSIFYGGIMSAGVAFTLQIVGQKYAEPSTAAIVMSFESIFGALSAWILLNEIMSSREIYGCFLMLIGMIVTQMKMKFRI